MLFADIQLQGEEKDVFYLYLLFPLEAHSRPFNQRADGAKRQSRKPLPEGGYLLVHCSHLHVNASILCHANDWVSCDLMCVHEILCRLPIAFLHRGK